MHPGRRSALDVDDPEEAMTMDEPDLRIFDGLDTCAVSDALVRLGIEGMAAGLAPVSVARPVCGRAVTVRLGPATSGPAPSGPAPRHLCTAAVASSGPFDVIVVSGARRTDTASWGGILSLAAVVRGVRGVVVDGAVRDVDESRALDLPIYARAVTPRTARGRLLEQEWNAPISVADVEVVPGDIVVADGSGVVFVPIARAEEVAASARRIQRREQLMAERVRAGDSVVDVMGADYEHLLDA
jgi:regulator of RNase E activity RraA